MGYKDKEKQKEYYSKYYQKNRDKMIFNMKEYYNNHRSRCNERSATLYIKHREKAIKRAREYNLNNPDKVKLSQMNFRATKHGVIHSYIKNINSKYKIKISAKEIITNYKDLSELILLIRQIKNDLKKKEMNK